ncbi:hypothetical protein GCM10012275_45910 [Longimycelium tulufanense]|uniref:Immunity protein Imm1 n=1 Tax=Longimycelium tulufanense TaxID=907463 RepID=A0A8J3CG24_9PSEU|nr:Imm1 family immunity protein [Longimycelium tulufanense]GGM70339.1 hypothetical protein GCM10012275_45910 [Longimycelium tulufanense]
MPYTIEAYYANPQGADSVLLSAAEELDGLVDDLAAAGPEDRDALLYLAGVEVPARELRVEVDGQASVGALSFTEDTGSTATWFSHSGHGGGGLTTLYADRVSRMPFPPDALLPLDTVRQALREFRRTGQRPTCVDWQPAGFQLAAAACALTWLQVPA